MNIDFQNDGNYRTSPETGELEVLGDTYDNHPDTLDVVVAEEAVLLYAVHKNYLSVDK